MWKSHMSHVIPLNNYVMHLISCRHVINICKRQIATEKIEKTNNLHCRCRHHRVLVFNALKHITAQGFGDQCTQAHHCCPYDKYSHPCVHDLMRMSWLADYYN